MLYPPSQGLALEVCLACARWVACRARVVLPWAHLGERRASRACPVMLVAAVVVALSVGSCVARAEQLEVGFAHTDITPELSVNSPVWLAGYYPGRAAQGVHDPLYARCVVLKSDAQKIAWVSVDLIGLQFPTVRELRKRLTDYSYVLVASTHNHEGPDVIGAWGQTFLHRGVNEDYLALVVARVEQAVREAEQHLRPAAASFGTAADESLLRDNRQPIVKDGVLRLLRFTDPEDASTVGVVVQWNCHPEALGADNPLITADFPAATIATLQSRYQCPVVYFTGAVGGHLAPPTDRIRNERGEILKEGDFEYARRYGEEVAGLAERAISNAKPLAVTPFRVSAARVGVPTTNELYRWARLLGIVRRDAYAWNGEGVALGEPLHEVQTNAVAAIETEVACLRLGELFVLAVPGEIYPELVYGQREERPQPGVDFPEAPPEPSVTDIVPSDPWMLFGLANDEIGYIVPQRQWDRLPPFAYGLTAPQYGEINSCGPGVAAVIMAALRKRVAALRVPQPASER
ncbi:MAG: neutral/alkaline non-lysosomal ceramidase N-terminal domain-containing protein [Pirellulaceae bacterium]